MIIHIATVSVANATKILQLFVRHLVVHVDGRVDASLGERRDLGSETLLDRLDDLFVGGAANEGDAEALGTEATSTTDTVKVRIGLLGHVVVDGDVDALDVDTATEDVGGDADAGLELLELFVTLDAMESQY